MNITNEDNMKLMARYEDNHFDLAIVDPPYGAFDKMTKGGHTKKWAKTLGVWDFAPNKEYFTELQRVSKDQIIWGANYFADKIPVSNRWIIFEKYGLDKLPQFELGWTSLNVPNKIWGASRLDLNINWGKLIHPTQKPVKLYEWLLMQYAKEGDKILDTHLGSGSIAIACHNLKYDLTACELDAEYYDAAMKRLKDHQKQITMF